MLPEEATSLTERCFNGEPASCSFACPFRLDLRSFLDKAANGKWAGAYKALRSAVSFPVVVAALCPHPCEEACQRRDIGDEPIAVNMLEKAALRYVKTRKAESYAIPPKTEKIAVVGAGMAGLSFALHMALKKFSVTVFDAAEGWGGHLRSHPDFAEFDEDIRLQFSVVKAEFVFGRAVTSLDELAEYDAVYVATGAGGVDFGLLPGWDAENCATARNKVFLGGELAGQGLMESIAQGPGLAQTVEIFLQLGKVAPPKAEFPRGYCGHRPDHSGAERKARIVPAEGVEFSEEEARAEAGRCLQCDCDQCMVACEMLKKYRKKPKKLAVEVYADSKAKPPISPCSLTRETFSCNDCGYCKAICSEDVDIGALLSLGRHVRVAAGTEPKALHHFWLREMDFAAGEASYVTPGKHEVLFFPGCQLSASLPEAASKAFDWLRSRYDAGIFLGCCGAPAHWAGDGPRMNANVERIRAAWEKAGRPRFVFACASCEKLFAAFLPEIERVSLYALLAEEGGPVPEKCFEEASVFDPCAARDFAEMGESVRALAGKAGVALEELKEKNRCCGYGGQMKTANPKLFDEIAANRAALGEKPYLVYCANCREVFLSKGKDCAHVLELIFGAAGPVPTLQEKRDNVIMLKQRFMKEAEGKDFSPTAHEWDGLRLTVPAEVTAAMEAKLITLGDVKEVIWRAEQSGDKFVDGQGVCLADLVTPIIVYWVEYRAEADGSYTVLSAYNHRIHFEEGV